MTSSNNSSSFVLNEINEEDGEPVFSFSRTHSGKVECESPQNTKEIQKHESPTTSEEVPLPSSGSVLPASQTTKRVSVVKEHPTTTPIETNNDPSNKSNTGTQASTTSYANSLVSGRKYHIVVGLTIAEVVVIVVLLVVVLILAVASYKTAKTQNLIRALIAIAVLTIVIAITGFTFLYFRSRKLFRKGKPLPKGICTFVFTDIENSTKLFEENSRLTLKAMMLHHETMETVWNSYNGIAFKSEGDSVGLAFQHPEEAISFCLAAQINLLRASWPPELDVHGYGPIFDDTAENMVFNGLRGAATGIAIRTNSKLTHMADWYGRTVNLSARCEQCAQGGQVLIEEVTVQKLRDRGLLMSSKFNKELEQYDYNHNGVCGIIRFYGEYALKGITNKTRLFEVIPESLIGKRFFVQLTQDDIDKQIDYIATEANKVLFRNIDSNVAQSLKEIMESALEDSIQLTNSDIGYVAFVNKEQNQLTMYGWSKNAVANCKMIDKPIVYQLENTGIWGEALRQRRPIILNDYDSPNPMKRGLPHGHIRVRRNLNIPDEKGRVVLVAGVGQSKPNGVEYSDNVASILISHYSSLWPHVKILVKSELYDKNEDVLEELSNHGV